MVRPYAAQAIEAGTSLAAMSLPDVHSPARRCRDGSGGCGRFRMTRDRVPRSAPSLDDVVLGPGGPSLRLFAEEYPSAHSFPQLVDRELASRLGIGKSGLPSATPLNPP